MSELKCRASARRFLGDAGQRPGTEEIDDDRCGDDGESGGSRFDGVDAFAKQPLRRLENHDCCEQK